MRPRLSGSVRRRTATVLGACVGATLLTWTLAVPASAHHPEVTAEVGCDQVQLRVVPWVGEPDNPATPQDEVARSRTNPEIALLLSVNGGAYERLEQQPDWEFSAPDYGFDETLPIPEGARAVSVRVDAASPWANGAAPGNPRTTSAVMVPECGKPAVTVSDSGDLPADNPPLPPAPTTVPPEPTTVPPEPTTVPREDAAATDPAADRDPGGGGVQLLPWLAGAVLVGATGRVLQNLLRRSGDAA